MPAHHCMSGQAWMTSSRQTGTTRTARVPISTTRPERTCLTAVPPRTLAVAPLLGRLVAPHMKFEELRPSICVCQPVQGWASFTHLDFLVVASPTSRNTAVHLSVDLDHGPRAMDQHYRVYYSTCVLVSASPTPLTCQSSTSIFGPVWLDTTVSLFLGSSHSSLTESCRVTRCTGALGPRAALFHANRQVIHPDVGFVKLAGPRQ